MTLNSRFVIAAFVIVAAAGLAWGLALRHWA